MSKLGVRGAALAAIAVLGWAASESARASVFTFDVTEQGGDVEVTGSGSINLVGLTSGGDDNNGSGIVAKHAELSIGGAVQVYLGVSGPANFGSGSGASTTNPTGDPVGIAGGLHQLFVPQGYVSGDSLSGSMMFANATFASLGVTPGVYTYTWGNSDIHNSLVVDIEVPSTVPEPSTWAMMLIGFAGLGLAAPRRKGAVEAISV
jgi:hypothetical protein